MTTYHYATGDLLSNRNTYFYTSFEGQTLLDDWQSDRAAAAASLGQETEPPEAAPTVSAADLYNKAGAGETIETSVLLETLYGHLSKNNERISEDVASLINRMIKRFEISKRIHTAYGNGFRAVDKESHRDMGLYVRAAEVFELAYSRLNDLPSLNVLLKCIDTLCALNTDLNPEQGTRLARLVNREKDHIRTLAKTMAIEL